MSELEKEWAAMKTGTTSIVSCSLVRKIFEFVEKVSKKTDALSPTKLVL